MTDLTKYAMFKSCRQFHSVFGTYEMGDYGSGKAALTMPGSTRQIVLWDEATAMAEEDFYSRDPDRLAVALYEEGWEDAKADIKKAIKANRIQQEIYDAGYDDFNLEVL